MHKHTIKVSKNNGTGSDVDTVALEDARKASGSLAGVLDRAGLALETCVSVVDLGGWYGVEVSADDDATIAKVRDMVGR